MLTKSTLITILVLIFTGVVKANLHFIRMLVMAAAGLAGMYLIHLLAQDYNKITNRPAATAAKALVAAGKALGIFKRSVPDNFDLKMNDSINEVPDFYNILENDPAGCARKLVCSLATQSQSKLLPEDINILEMIRNRNFLEGNGKEEFEEAANIGARTKDVSYCEEEYKKCRYSARQLIKIMRTF